MTNDAAQLETKLAAARARLILDKPFLGALALRLPMVPAKKDWCPTTATDARTFYFNPEYIAALSLPETQFVLAHEALHWLDGARASDTDVDLGALGGDDQAVGEGPLCQRD